MIVRVDEPAVAVIVTEMAFVLCQWSVTLCPASIELVFAEKTKVGALWCLLGLGVLVLEQEQRHQATAIVPRATQRKLIVFIRCLRAKLRVAINVRQSRCCYRSRWLRMIFIQCRRWVASNARLGTLENLLRKHAGAPRKTYSGPRTGWARYFAPATAALMADTSAPRSLPSLPFPL
jgi:hypothetical protein